MSGTIKLEEGSGGDHVGFKAPADIAAEVIWELPATDGAAGQHMVTDGVGKLSWTGATPMPFVDDAAYVSDKGSAAVDGDRWIILNGPVTAFTKL